MRRSKIGKDLEKSIANYVTENFKQHTSEVQDDIKFNICCLIYPKELISNKIDLLDVNSQVLKGKDRSIKVK